MEVVVQFWVGSGVESVEFNFVGKRNSFAMPDLLRDLM